MNELKLKLANCKMELKKKNIALENRERELELSESALAKLQVKVSNKPINKDTWDRYTQHSFWSDSD